MNLLQPLFLNPNHNLSLMPLAYWLASENVQGEKSSGDPGHVWIAVPRSVYSRLPIALCRSSLHDVMESQRPLN